MRTLGVFIVLSLLTSDASHADYFRIMDGATSYYIPYAKVEEDDGSVIGYTDAYGRIRINLPLGQRTVKVIDRGVTKSVSLRVDGRPNLKRVEASN